MTKSDEKLFKLAVIRSNDTVSCPFGLDIPYGCKTAGDLVRKMAPVDILGDDADEEERQEIANANNHLFRWKAPGERCIYAEKLFKENKVVQCNWDTNTAGRREEGALRGSPFFYRHLSGTGLDGLYTYPLGWYTDNSIDRGMYYGMYSIESTGSKDTGDDE